MEGAVKRFLIPDQPESEWLQKLEQAKACPLPIPSCNNFLPGSLKSTGPAADHEGILQYSEIAFRRAHQVGVKIIVFGSSGSRMLPEGFPRKEAQEQFVSVLRKMGPLAQAHGVTVAVEPLRRQECNFINTISEGATIVEKVNHPNIRLLFDIYHMLQNGEDPSDLKKVGHLLVHGHIAEKETRSAPGVAGDDFRPFFAALKSIGYKGRISVEGKWKWVSSIGGTGRDSFAGSSFRATLYFHIPANVICREAFPPSPPASSRKTSFGFLPSPPP